MNEIKIELANTMGKIQAFEDLEIWQGARIICREVWHFMENTTLANDYRPKNQMNGASGSIMDNIAEGLERDGNKEFYQFLSISKASCGELRSQLYRCLDRNHIDKASFDATVKKTEIESKKIAAFMRYLKNSDRKGSKYD